MINPTAIGQRLKVLRADATQQEFAERLGVGRATLARYEVGDRTPDAEFLLKAFYACQVDPLWLLTGRAESAAILSADEQVLITSYRTLNQDLRNATLRVALGAATPQSTSVPLNFGVVVSGNNNSGISGRDYYENGRKKDNDSSS